MHNSDPREENSGALRITVQDGVSCECRQGETVLAALARSGISLSAPCGGRGICGKCRITLIKGSVRLTENMENERGLQPGEFFFACRGIAISDITVELPKEENVDAPDMSREKPAGKKIRRAGVGIDIGTTSVQAELLDMETGLSLETISAINAQRSFGADVMSRIHAARSGKTGELHAAINGQIEGMLRHFISAWGLSGIKQCIVSGNTTMLHLFVGVDPSGMGEVPFTPVFLEERHFSGKDLSLSAERITLLPGISAFVGADSVSGLAFLDILNKDEDSLFVDIGTNGEIALWKEAEQRLLCCSTAAGPCFEGAEISCGMGALPGAINRISIGEKPADKYFSCGPLHYTTLGNVPPRGICGAALIDAMAIMKQLAIIDETGALADEYTETGFPLAEGIALSQRDVRQFQLAKSAILSGITVLCKRAGFENPGKLGTVYIAGGLGFYINPENAIIAGLLPAEFTAKKEEKNRIAVCGNTSLNGAVKSLGDPAFLPRCREIITRCDTVELASDSDFVEAFSENMYF